MRRALIAGNWKMHTDPAAASKLARQLKDNLRDSAWADFAVFPPFTSIYAVASELDGTNIEVGGQNIHWESEGAFTGEISASMLRNSGCRWVIIGHSERRAYFGETDQTVQKKAISAISIGLKLIICVGESLKQRESGITEDEIKTQITNGIGGIDDISSITIAYEPVWAIGTGRNATPEQAGDVHRFIRGLISSRWGDEVSKTTRILYGGSVKPDNAGSLWRMDDIDGFLVGGASLKADSFRLIADSVK